MMQRSRRRVGWFGALLLGWPTTPAAWAFQEASPVDAEALPARPGTVGAFRQFHLRSGLRTMYIDPGKLFRPELNPSDPVDPGAVLGVLQPTIPPQAAAQDGADSGSASPSTTMMMPAAPAPSMPSPDAPGKSPSAPGGGAGMPPTYPPPSDYSIDSGSTKLTFLYRAPKNLMGRFDLSGGSSLSRELLIKAAPGRGAVDLKVDLTLTVPIGKNLVRLPVKFKDVAWVEDRKAYVLDKTALDGAALQLVTMIDGVLNGFNADQPVKVTGPMTIEIAPAGIDPNKERPLPVRAAGSINLIFRQVAP